MAPPKFRVCGFTGMAAPISWAPGIFLFFRLENPHAHKIPRVRGGGRAFSGRGGGGSSNFVFVGVGIFPRKEVSELPSRNSVSPEKNSLSSVFETLMHTHSQIVYTDVHTPGYMHSTQGHARTPAHCAQEHEMHSSVKVKRGRQKGDGKKNVRKCLWQIGPLPLQPHFVRGPPPPGPSH